MTRDDPIQCPSSQPQCEAHGICVRECNFWVSKHYQIEMLNPKTFQARKILYVRPIRFLMDLRVSIGLSLAWIAELKATRVHPDWSA